MGVPRGTPFFRMSLRILRKNIRNTVKQIRIYRDEMSTLAVMLENVELALKKEQIRRGKKASRKDIKGS